MISTEFEFFAPREIDEAFRLLRQHGEEAKVLAGGMSLVPLMSLGLAHPRVVVSLNHLSGLDQVEEMSASLRIGAMARHKAIGANALVERHTPLLGEAARSIGDVQVRNRGTIGGSLAHADPAADYPSVMLALGARFQARSEGGERVIESNDFFVDVMTTALAPDELLVAIEIPKPPGGSGFAHERLRRVEGAFPIVTASALLEPSGGRARVGLGGVGPRPALLDITGRLSQGPGDDALATIGRDAFEASAAAMEDLNGSTRYRREMARLYCQRAVQKACARIGEGALR